MLGKDNNYEKKKYLLFTIFVLGFGIAGINGYLPKEDNISIIKGAETDFVIDNNGTDKKWLFLMVWSK